MFSAQLRLSVEINSVKADSKPTSAPVLFQPFSTRLGGSLSLFRPLTTLNLRALPCLPVDTSGCAPLCREVGISIATEDVKRALWQRRHEPIATSNFAELN